jgi:Tfp pilus assembly protein PilW
MSIEIAMKKTGFPHLVTKQLGMGLVEILVGLVIGLIGVLVIFQTMAVWGERTATTVSGSDSRTSGAVGMHYLEQDLAQGGLGFGRINSPGRQFEPGCNVNVPNGITPEGGNFRLAAVDINDGASGAPDTVTVLYAGSSDANVNFSDVALFKPVSGKYYSSQGRALLKRRMGRFGQAGWDL